MGMPMITTPRWDHYPLVAREQHARSWLVSQANLGRALKTVEAYGRALQDFLIFSAENQVDPSTAGREHVASYVRHLLTRPRERGENVRVLDSGGGLASATLQQRLTAVRLYYDHLMEEGLRVDNPVGRGRYTPGRGFGGPRDRGLVPRYQKLPIIPSDEQWQLVLEAAHAESVRNRFMFALAYDAALRREELCSLEVGDIDPAYRLVRIRAETSKSRRDRVVPYSEATGALFGAFLSDRRTMCSERGPLFRSHSDRNRAAPISPWTWSKVIRGIALRAGVAQFATHTPRHLRLTDLARAGWDIHAIATFAGHRTVESTLRYIHLSGRELASKLELSMDALHAERRRQLESLLW